MVLCSTAVNNRGLQCGAGGTERQLYVPVRPHPCCCHEDRQDVCGRERGGGVHEALPRVRPAVRPPLSTASHFCHCTPFGHGFAIFIVLCILQLLPRNMPRAVGSQHAQVWHGDEMTIPPSPAGTAQGIIPRSRGGTSSPSGSTTARMSGSAHSSCSQQVSVPSISCKTFCYRGLQLLMLIMQATSSYAQL